MDRSDKFWEQARKVPFSSGLVVAQQITPFAAVRVQFPAHDNMVSFWLPVGAMNTQDNKDFYLPDMGEQVHCLMDENFENGAVLGSLPSQADQTASGMSADIRATLFKDGTLIKYDRSAHTYTIALGTGGSLIASTPLGNSYALGSDGTVTLIDQAGTILKLSNDGNARLNNNLIVGGTIQSAGSITSTGGDVVAGTITLKTHLTSGVTSGGGESGPPIAG